MKETGACPANGETEGSLFPESGFTVRRTIGNGLPQTLKALEWLPQVQVEQAGKTKGQY